MRFEFEIDDRLRIVEIEKASDGFRVAVDGRRWRVDVVRLSADRWSLLVGDDERPVRSVEASVGSAPVNGALDVRIDGSSVVVIPRTGRGRRARAGGTVARGDAQGPHRVKAPMPGKIVRVLVKQGDQVKARQGLVVVEAMKMENELRASRDGRVRDVLVAEGQSVDAGAALVVVD